jgi:hypothetical protein
MRLIPIDIVHQRDNASPYPLLHGRHLLTVCTRIERLLLEQNSQHKCSGLVIQGHQQTFAVKVKLQQLRGARHRRTVPVMQKLQVIVARETARVPICRCCIVVSSSPRLDQDGFADPIPSSKLIQDFVGIAVGRSGRHEQAGRSTAVRAGAKILEVELEGGRWMAAVVACGHARSCSSAVQGGASYL